MIKFTFFRLIQFLLLAVFLIAGGGFLIYYFGNIDLSNIKPTEDSVIEPRAARLLNGTWVEPGQENFLPFAVLIENHFESRPVSGLSQAQVVYEVLTEATITRFLAIYDLTVEVEKIGPLRSVRPYFIELAAEYGAVLAHSGGSPAALTQLKTDQRVYDLNEFFGYNSNYFWRDQSRLSPHNLYTSTGLLAQAQEDYNWPVAIDLNSWLFKEEEPLKDQAEIIDDLQINYSINSAYQVAWQYQQEENLYYRRQSGQPHLDKDGAPITAKNVVVQFAPTRVIDQIGRRQIDLIGQNQALIFLDGQVIEGYWRKNGPNERTRFYNQNDQEIKFNRGLIWLQIVPDYLTVIY